MKAIVALVIAAALTVAAPSAAQADSLSDASLNCTALSGFKFELPAAGSARTSQFVFSVDGGRWEYSHFYYTHGLSYYQWMGSSWQQLGVGGGFLPIYNFDDESTHHVVAWEYRQNSTSNGWHYLGSCYASSYYGGGGIILR